MALLTAFTIGLIRPPGVGYECVTGLFHRGPAVVFLAIRHDIDVSRCSHVTHPRSG